MIRLCASSPPLWRTDRSLQLGVDAAVIVEDVLPWQERLLDALSDGIPDAMLTPLATALGAAPADVHGFVEGITPALDPAPPALARVHVESSGTVTASEAGVISTALEAAGLRPGPIAPDEVADSGIPRVVIAHRLLDPRRAAHLTGADIAHLPVELAGDRVTVGPLIVPGRTGCLICAHSHRRDRDPHWPAVAAQLLARPAPPLHRGLALEAGLLAAALISAQRAGVSARLTAGAVRRRWRAHRAHPQCLCRGPEVRSPAGTATDDAAAVPPPSSATACARPA